MERITTVAKRTMPTVLRMLTDVMKPNLVERTDTVNERHFLKNTANARHTVSVNKRKSRRVKNGEKMLLPFPDNLWALFCFFISLVSRARVRPGAWNISLMNNTISQLGSWV